jgi:hypothetical protein
MSLPAIPLAPNRGYVPPMAELRGNYLWRGEWIPLWPWWHPLILPRLFIFIGLPGWLILHFASNIPVPEADLLLPYLAYSGWMLVRYHWRERERRYIVGVLRSPEWRDRLVHWVVTGC